MNTKTFSNERKQKAEICITQKATLKIMKITMAIPTQQQTIINQNIKPKTLMQKTNPKTYIMKIRKIRTIINKPQIKYKYRILTIITRTNNHTNKLNRKDKLRTIYNKIMPISHSVDDKKIKPKMTIYPPLSTTKIIHHSLTQTNHQTL